ncbi:protein of unknown function [Pseudorhizobium banfieldiae]|uniref:Uncharacterized protein n=1 Tax=Pseudorhizobium banfieldiae TaxID=1125847 RepID=L0ND80_9HYPH|nr:protein of unknown function [Pseudorhizobium banfieldiae]
MRMSCSRQARPEAIPTEDYALLYQSLYSILSIQFRLDHSGLHKPRRKMLSSGLSPPILVVYISGANKNRLGIEGRGIHFYPRRSTGSRLP